MGPPYQRERNARNRLESPTKRSNYEWNRDGDRKADFQMDINSRAHDAAEPVLPLFLPIVADYAITAVILD